MKVTRQIIIKTYLNIMKSRVSLVSHTEKPAASQRVAGSHRCMFQLTKEQTLSGGMKDCLVFCFVKGILVNIP